jgi:hypothetical protein
MTEIYGNHDDVGLLKHEDPAEVGFADATAIDDLSSENVDADYLEAIGQYLWSQC